MSKNVIIKGTLILTIAGFLTKILGFYNRIFLTRVIGVKELGIYQLIFPIYMLAIAICCNGISTSLTKHISFYLGKNERAKAKGVFWVALITSLSFSIFFMFLIYNLSYPISFYILKNTDCEKLLKIISLALPFVAIKSCINAFFIGDGNSAVQGISHFVEQLIRVITAYILYYLLTSDKLDATLATISAITGEIFSGLLSVLIYYIYKSKKDLISSPTCDYSIIKPYFNDAIPITSNNLILTLFASLEAIILPAMLFKYYMNKDTSMELYGIITGIVIPFLLFPATITSSLSTMLLPAISKEKSKESYDKIKFAIFLCVGFCILLGFVVFIGYSFLGEWACKTAFKSPEAGVILKKMCFLCPFIYICGVLSTILNGLDKAFNNMIINVFGLTIRIIATSFLVPIWGLKAYILSILVSYVFMLTLMIVSIIKPLSNKN